MKASSGKILHYFRKKGGVWFCECCGQKRDRFGREVKDSSTSVAL